MSEQKINLNEQVWCEEDNKSYPKYTVDEKNDLTYELDPTTWTYSPIMSYTKNSEEQKLLSQPIGLYGKRWQEFMQENYQKVNPRPHTFTEIFTWEKMRQLETQHTLMTEIVLKHRA